ncbi:MAG TPA: nucleotidyltransferase family protein [Terriglobales bacterium]|nr:nucleotidyltransferase family protein [Terriglobales bacterium]
MKAFLLAAGHGTRLRPYTDSAPKCLLPVKGVPMLEIWLTQCRRSGISEVLVNTHAHAAAVFDFARRWKDGMKVRIVEEPELFGSAGTLRVNRSFVEGESRFWVFYADVLTTMDFQTMLESHLPGSAATLGVYSVPDPRRCGVVELGEQDTIVEFVEKPAQPRSNLAFAGIMIGTPQLLDAIPDKPGADIAFDVLPRLAGKMRAFRIASYLLDIGTLENYELANRTWPGIRQTTGGTLAK